MFRYLVIGLAAVGMFGLLALVGWLQSAPIHAWGFGITWAMLSCAVFGLAAMLQIKG
jgi:hypothetical protein